MNKKDILKYATFYLVLLQPLYVFGYVTEVQLVSIAGSLSALTWGCKKLIEYLFPGKVAGE